MYILITPRATAMNDICYPCNSPCESYCLSGDAAAKIAALLPYLPQLNALASAANATKVIPYQLDRKLARTATYTKTFATKSTTNLVSVQSEVVINSITGSLVFSIDWIDENGNPQSGNFIPNGG